LPGDAKVFASSAVTVPARILPQKVHSRSRYRDDRGRILPTGFECGVLNGKVEPGCTVAIVDAGPIGLSRHLRLI
jgi:hypothetical protein